LKAPSHHVQGGRPCRIAREHCDIGQRAESDDLTIALCLRRRSQILGRRVYDGIAIFAVGDAAEAVFAVNIERKMRLTMKRTREPPKDPLRIEPRDQTKEANVAAGLI
jgi:hypothetical protein